MIVEQIVECEEGIRPVSSSRSVLVAEDDPVAQIIIKNNLAKIVEAEVTIVDDGAEALALCNTDRFDLLIFDLNLPSIKGTRLISFLRTSPGKNATTPAMLLSAHTASDLAGIKGVALADAVMTKPLDFAVFEAHVSLFIT